MSSVTPIPSNAYSYWVEIAELAQSELVIFTPYFDEIILEIFESSSLSNHRKSLVTQLDWRNDSRQGINQKAVMDIIISRGIDVRVLPRLHAKAIVSDWDRAIVGSQNFTYYSQDSLEISFLLDRFAEGADLDEVFQTMNEWWEMAGDDEEHEE